MNYHLFALFIVQYRIRVDEREKKESRRDGGSGIGNYSADSDGSANHHFALPNVEPLWQQNMFYSLTYNIPVHTR